MLLHSEQNVLCSSPAGSGTRDGEREGGPLVTIEHFRNGALVGAWLSEVKQDIGKHTGFTRDSPNS